jgi:hypothetical protein
VLSRQTPLHVSGTCWAQQRVAEGAAIAELLVDSVYGGAVGVLTFSIGGVAAVSIAERSWVGVDDKIHCDQSLSTAPSAHRR